MTEKQRMKLQYSKVEDLGLHKVDLHSLFLDPSVWVLGFLFYFYFFVLFSQLLMNVNVWPDSI